MKNVKTVINGVRVFVRWSHPVVDADNDCTTFGGKETILYFLDLVTAHDPS